jgi:hypothetical protein
VIFGYVFLFFSLIVGFIGSNIQFSESDHEVTYIERIVPTEQVDEIFKLYQEIDPQEFINYNAFRHAYRGYLELSKNSQRNLPRILTIIDFTKSSVERRLFIIDFSRNELLHKTLVAHGKNSGVKEANSFSNTQGSYQSSLGFYLTGKTYFGKHGYSLKLIGLEKGINDNAERRSIVMHGASYATQNFIKKYGRLGRSWGCPAVPPQFSKEIIDTIKEGSIIFIYAEQSDYLNNSEILN